MPNFDSKFSGLSVADSAMAGVRAAMDKLAGVRDLTNAINLATGAMNFDPALNKKLAGIPDYQRDLSAIRESMASAAQTFKGIESVKDQMKLAGFDTGLSKVVQQIADQQSAIASLKPAIPEMPGLSMPERKFSDLRTPEMRIPPNPIHETNKRLARIDQRFNRMEKIALDSAEIATGLQASAATFLAKFEKASSDNDRTSARVIWLARVAIVMAVAMPVAQVFYTELWRAPADSASMQAAIVDMKREISGLQDTQKAASEELGKVLSSGNADRTNALREIRDLLAEQRKKSVVVIPGAEPRYPDYDN